MLSLNAPGARLSDEDPAPRFRSGVWTRAMSSIPLKADIRQRGLHVRFVPEADIAYSCGENGRCGVPTLDWA
jgi:hypothetical protein